MIIILCISSFTIFCTFQNTLSTPQMFDTLQVDRDYVQMSKFVESKGHTFHNGRAYYEFIRDEEDILDDTDVVLMDKVTHLYYLYLISHQIHWNHSSMDTLGSVK